MNIMEEREIQLDTSISCPVCNSNTKALRDAPGWGEWRQCEACTLEFAYPLRLGRDPDKRIGCMSQSTDRHLRAKFCLDSVIDALHAQVYRLTRRKADPDPIFTITRDPAGNEIGIFVTASRNFVRLDTEGGT